MKLHFPLETCSNMCKENSRITKVLLLESMGQSWPRVWTKSCPSRSFIFSHFLFCSPLSHSHSPWKCPLRVFVICLFELQYLFPWSPYRVTSKPECLGQNLLNISRQRDFQKEVLNFIASNIRRKTKLQRISWYGWSIVLMSDWSDQKRVHSIRFEDREI